MLPYIFVRDGTFSGVGVVGISSLIAINASCAIEIEKVAPLVACVNEKLYLGLVRTIERFVIIADQKLASECVSLDTTEIVQIDVNAVLALSYNSNLICKDL